IPLVVLPGRCPMRIPSVSTWRRARIPLDGETEFGLDRISRRAPLVTSVACFGLIAAIVLAASTAPASRLSLVSGTCNVNVLPFTSFNWYVVAELFGDAAASGITGAMFTVHGENPSWFTTHTQNPASNIPIMDAWTPCNISIGFPACQT